MQDPTYRHPLFHPNSVAGDNIFAWLGFGLARRDYAAMLACLPSSLAKALHSGGPPMKFIATAVAVAFALISSAASAADYPEPIQGEWVAKNFRFHTGETMPELRLHYPTIGEAAGQPG